jgi:hypothetical protein
MSLSIRSYTECSAYDQWQFLSTQSDAATEYLTKLSDGREAYAKKDLTVQLRRVWIVCAFIESV